MINVFQPSLGKEELAAIKEVFDSNWIGRGPKTDAFESAFARYMSVDREQICSISCCTEGLFQSMKLIDLQPGEEVILPTISFIGAVNAIADSRGVPVFADVDPLTLNLTVEELEKRITSRTKAVLLLHYGGHPCEMDKILSFCKEHQLIVIEDNACSPVSTYKGRATGTLGDIGIWSFDAMKILVTGDGGMVYCKEQKAVEKLRHAIYLGLMANSGFTSAQDKRWWAFDIDQPGRRAIMNDISSAIGLAQLEKLSSFIQRRKEVHTFFDKHLEGVEKPPQLPEGCESSYYFYRIRLESQQIRDELAAHLKEKGIYTTFRYYPLHLVPYYQQDSMGFPHATHAAMHDLCIPLHQSLSQQNIEKIVSEIHRYGLQRV